MIGKFYLVIVLIANSGVSQHSPNQYQYTWDACRKAGLMTVKQNSGLRNVGTSFNCVPAPETAATMEEPK